MATPASPPGSPPSRPSSPSPSRTGLRTLARMGTMLRRNSTGFGFKRSESKSSLRKEVASEETYSVPSPVAESPVREAAAVAAETGSPYVAIGPSPLSKPELLEATAPAAPATTAASTTPSATPMFAAPLPPTAPVALAAPAPAPTAPAPAISSPAIAPVPPAAPVEPVVPVASTSPAPPAPIPVQRAFVAEPEPAVQSPPQQTAPISVQPPAQPAAPSAVAQATPPAPAVSQPQPAPVVERRASSVSRHGSIAATSESGLQSPPASVPAPPPAVQERAADYFAWGGTIPEQPTKRQSTSTIGTEDSVPTRSSVPASIAPAGQAEPYVVPAPDPYAWREEGKAPSAKSMGKRPSRDQFVSSPEQSARALSKSPSREQMVSSPHSIALTLSPKASRSSIASSYGQVVNVGSGRRRVSVSVDPEEGRRGRSRSKASIRISFDDGYSDPFTDPQPSNQLSVPKHALSPIYSVNFPDDSVEDASIPRTLEPESISYPEPQLAPVEKAQSVHYESPSPVSMPLPNFSDVTTSNRGMRDTPSAYSIGTTAVAAAELPPHETNERLPLLPRMPIPDIGTSKSAVDPPEFNDIDVTISRSKGISWPVMERGFRALGWAEHPLPDSSVYYFHRELRVATDVDLRNSRKLDLLSEYLDRKRPGETILPPPGWELWLRDESKLAFDFIPVKNWVNHRDRIFTRDPPAQPFRGPAPPAEDDHLDEEYRYWNYIEGHPAHELLAPSAYAEAMDFLTWCYTDFLLPSERPVPPPFNPQECQELMGLLRLENGASSAAGGNNIVRTRIVARVLLRQVHWRQQNFRPNKPLPTDVTRGPAPSGHKISFGRIMMDLIVSILCLGIPYIFISRAGHHRTDQEGGMRNQGALLVVGACSCIVAAVILSASVTLLTLPGLDHIARIAGIVAIVFSASSMVSAVVALFKYKSELERTVVYVGGEGLMVLYRRSIVMSLPLVFLAWATAAFITGITYYSFRSFTLTSKVIAKQPYIDYTHWAVVGGLGGLAGVLLVSVLMARKEAPLDRY